jgi:hypothetical protein
MAPKRTVRPTRGLRALRYPDRAALMAATLERCRGELAAVDARELAADQSAWAFSSLLYHLDTDSEDAALKRAILPVVGMKCPQPAFATPLAALVSRCPRVDAYTLALRALLVGYEPTLAGRDATILTTSDVIATVRKAVDSARKAQVGK